MRLHTFAGIGISFAALIGLSITQLAAAEIQPCGKESVQTGQTRRVTGSEIYVRTGPRESAEKIINQKATSILGRTEYITIDFSETVYEECTQSGWSKISVIEPDWLREHKGWVPSKTLRAQQRDASGLEVFTEEDFHWEKDTLPYKSIIIAGVNKIHRENSRCHDLDPSSANLALGKGTKTDPVFFVTCGHMAGAFNVFFSKSDVEHDKKFPAAAHLDKSTAIDLCEAYAKSHATHPSTVDFSRVMDLAVTEHPNGNTTLHSTFTAKNSFNLQLKYRIRCLLNSKGLIEANISEAR